MRKQILVSAVACATLTSPVAESSAYTATNKGSFFVAAPIEEVFPLFGAAEEAKWAPGWAPSWIFPERTVAENSNPERGWVFKTSANSAAERIWYIEEFDRAGHKAVYVVHWPKHMIYRIQVTSEAVKDGVQTSEGTKTNVQYDFVGLSKRGNREVKKRTENPQDFAEEMRHWGELINGYFGQRHSSL